MCRVTELLSKPIISLYEGKTQGTIKNVIFDKKLTKLMWLVLFDDRDMLEQKFLAISDIYSLGENAVVIKNDGAIISSLSEVDSTKENNPINLAVYTAEGSFLEAVSDVILDDKYKVSLIELKSGKQLTPDEFVVYGEDALILQDKQKPININSLKQKGFPEITQQDKLRKVTTMNSTKKDCSPDNNCQKDSECDKSNCPKKTKEEQILMDNIKSQEQELEKSKLALKEQTMLLEKEIKSLAQEEQIENNTPPTIEQPAIDVVPEPILEVVPKPTVKTSPKTKAAPKTAKTNKTQDKKTASSTKKAAKSTPREAAKPKPKDAPPKAERSPKKNTSTKKQISKKIEPKDNKAKKDKLETLNMAPLIRKKYIFNNNSPSPSKILTNNSFLLNRVATKSILAHTGEVIVKPGEKITTKIINSSLISGKLPELIKYSKNF